ncbi:unnamed protein product [Urochloa humidicola]
MSCSRLNSDIFLQSREASWGICTLSVARLERIAQSSMLATRMVSRKGSKHECLFLQLLRKGSKHECLIHAKCLFREFNRGLLLQRSIYHFISNKRSSKEYMLQEQRC